MVFENNSLTSWCELNFPPEMDCCPVTAHPAVFYSPYTKEMYNELFNEWLIYNYFMNYLMDIIIFIIIYY